MSQPYEIIVTPGLAYVAPTGSAFPALSGAVGAPWLAVGKAGRASYSNDGIKITHSQTIVEIMPDGVSMPVKYQRTTEVLSVEFTIWDLTLEAYSLVLNSNGVTDTPAASGVAGNRTVSMYRGADVKTLALLIVFDSPYMDGGRMQYEIPIVSHDGNPAPLFKKGAPAGILFNFKAVFDSSNPNAPVGQIRAQTAAALP